MKWLALAVALAGCSSKKAKGTDCEAIADHAAALVLALDSDGGAEGKAELAELRKLSMDALRSALIEECTEKKFDADDRGCVFAAKTAWELVDPCRFSDLRSLLGPKLECPAGAVQRREAAGDDWNAWCEAAGTREGPAVMFDDGGTILVEATYKAGVLDGPYARGDLKGTYRGGKRHGTWTASDGGKNPISVELVDGVPEGAYSRVDDEERAEGHFAGGKRTGTWTFSWPGGELKASGAYKDDKRTGTWTFRYAPQGDVTRAIPVDAGAPRDPIAARGMYKDGVRAKDWTFFGEDGRAIGEKAALELEWLAAALADDATIERAAIDVFTSGPT